MDDLVEELCATPRTALCRTCQLKNVERINTAIAAFNAKRASGETTLEWTAFCRMLQDKLNYPHEIRALKRHAENCLGIRLA